MPLRLLVRPNALHACRSRSLLLPDCVKQSNAHANEPPFPPSSPLPPPAPPAPRLLPPYPQTGCAQKRRTCPTWCCPGYRLPSPCGPLSSSLAVPFHLPGPPAPAASSPLSPSNRLRTKTSYLSHVALSRLPPRPQITEYANTYCRAIRVPSSSGACRSRFSGAVVTDCGG